MNVIKNEWSGLFAALEAKVSAAGRQSLLGEMILQVKDSCLSNFGKNAAGDMRPWFHEELVSEDYSRTISRTFATLERTEKEREACEGTRWQGGDGAHLKDSFFTYGGGDSMTLVNICDYASNQQLGEGVPARPFFPVDESENLMPFMEARFATILNVHFSV